MIYSKPRPGVHFHNVSPEYLLLTLWVNMPFIFVLKVVHNLRHGTWYWGCDLADEKGKRVYSLVSAAIYWCVGNALKKITVHKDFGKYMMCVWFGSSWLSDYTSRVGKVRHWQTVTDWLAVYTLCAVTELWSAFIWDSPVVLRYTDFSVNVFIVYVMKPW